jgi:hypothetical protein
MRHRDADEVLRYYKFVVVFENSNCRDYVTEKLWRALRMGVVPVYMGARNVREDFLPTPDAAVVVSDFATVAVRAVSNHVAFRLVSAFLWHCGLCSGGSTVRGWWLTVLCVRLWSRRTSLPICSS